MARHMLLRPARPIAGAQRYHPDPFAVGEVVEVLADIVTVNPVLPLHQPRVRTGSHVRILGAIDDPTELTMHYRFEVLDARGRATGWWAFAAVENLTALPAQSRWARLRGWVG
jgi:hypothetical protein